MSKVEDFLTTAQEQAIVASIRKAEENTSGEIRVHLERSTEKDALDRAKEVFYFLKMDQTEQHNGILFYVAVDDKKFSIIGDKGINDVVPNNFWDSIKDTVLSHFAIGDYLKGLELGISETGLKLKEFFPFHSKDKNELSDEISLS